MFDNVLFVCSGNICRSPFAAYLFKKAFPNKKVSSAGTSALVDYPADKTAQDLSLQYGIDLSQHKARQLTDKICRENELILAMETEHIEAISIISPVSVGKVMLLSHWIGKQSIQDPYRQEKSYYMNIFQQIECAIDSWQGRI